MCIGLRLLVNCQLLCSLLFCLRVFVQGLGERSYMIFTRLVDGGNVAECTGCCCLLGVGNHMLGGSYGSLCIAFCCLCDINCFEPGLFSLLSSCLCARFFFCTICCDLGGCGLGESIFLFVQIRSCGLLSTLLSLLILLVGGQHLLAIGPCIVRCIPQGGRCVFFALGVCVDASCYL